MRKVMLSIMLVPLFTMAQIPDNLSYDYDDVGWYCTSKDSSLVLLNSSLYDMGVKDSTVIIHFHPDSSPYISDWFFSIKNLSNDPITVKWTKSQIDGSRIIFKEMKGSRQNEVIPDDVIYPESDPLMRYITTINMADNPFIRPLYLADAKKAFRKTKTPQEGHQKFIVCIEVGGKDKIYRFQYNAVYNGKRPKTKKKL